MAPRSPASSDRGRVPPHDLEAEASVLGAILLDPASVARVGDLVDADDFYRENNSQVYRAVLALVRAGGPVDAITLAAELEKHGVLERVGGRAHLAMLREQTPTAANVEHYARIVKDRACKRRLIAAGSQLAELGYEDALDADEAVAQARARVDALSAGPPLVVGLPTLIRISDVVAESVEWLWWRRLPLGKVVVLDGDPGLGKSTLTLDLAARVSVGREMPDGQSSVPGGAGVVVMSAEDGLADTIRPRLEAAGADLDRVVTFKVHGGAGEERFPELPGDIPSIENVIGQVDAKLLIVDPLMAYLAGDVNSHRDQDVRRALAPLAELADRAHAAVVVVRHLNKASGGNPLYRGGGSIGIGAAARVVLLVAKDPADDERRVLAPLKQNLSAPAPALTYRLVETASGVARVEWEGTADITAAELLVVANGDATDDRSALGDAEAFLCDVLADGPVPSKQVMKEARDAGIAEKTLQRAKRSLAVTARKLGMHDGWTWSLPEDGHGVATFEGGQESAKTVNRRGWPSSAPDGHLRGAGDIPEALP